MFKALKHFFGLTEVQQRTYNLVKEALEAKKYTLHKSEFFYYDGRHHSLDVTIHLTPTVQVHLHSLFATTDLLVSNPQDPEMGPVWNSEISSGQTYKMIRRHFEDMLLREEDRLEHEYRMREEESTKRLMGEG